MTILEFWYILKRYRWLLMAMSLTVGVLVGVHSMLKRPLYSVSVVLSPARASDDSGLSARLGQLGGLIGIGGLGQSVGSEKNEVMAVLTSQQFTERFIQEQNLLPVLFPDKWDAKSQKWLVQAAEDAPTLQDGYRMFDRNIRFVRDDPETGLVTLEIRWFDRQRAASWANMLVERLNADVRARAIQEAEQSIAYLNTQLEATSLVELRQAIFRLIEQNISKVMLAKGRPEFAFKVIDPALVPDVDKYMAPYRLLRVSIGLVVGFLLGLMISFAHFFLRQESAGTLPGAGIR